MRFNPQERFFDKPVLTVAHFFCRHSTDESGISRWNVLDHIAERDFFPIFPEVTRIVIVRVYGVQVAVKKIEPLILRPPTRFR